MSHLLGEIKDYALKPVTYTFTSAVHFHRITINRLVVSKFQLTDINIRLIGF